MFIPEPTFPIPDPGFRVDKMPQPDLHQRVLVFLTQTSDTGPYGYPTKFSKVRFEMFIPGPRSGFFPSWVSLELVGQ
jgi:hypothetical protein